MKATSKFAVMLVAASFAFSAFGSVAASHTQKPTGWVNDFAGVLDDSTEVRLENKIADFEKKTTYEIAVVTVRSLNGMSVEDYTRNLATEWGVGKAGKNNGVVLLVAVNEREIRIEVAEGARGKLTDGEATRIIDRTIVPPLKEGKFGEGVEAGSYAIMGQLEASDGGPVAAAILLVVFGAVALIIAIWALVAWMVRRSRTRRQTIDQVESYRISVQGFADSYRKAESNLKALKADNPPAVWQELDRAFKESRIGSIRDEFDALVLQAGSHGHREEVIESVNSFQNRVNAASELLTKIQACVDDVETARAESPLVMADVPVAIAEAEAAVERADVSEETRDIVQKAKDKLASASALAGETQPNWLEVKRNLQNALVFAQQAKTKANEDITLAEKARTEGPRMLEELEAAIAKTERQLASSGSSEAKALVSQAREKYNEARRLAAPGVQVNWLHVYILLVAVNSLSTRAHSTHQSYTSYRPRPSYGGGAGGARRGGSSGSFGGGFGGFGGGGGFRGGGGSGRF